MSLVPCATCRRHHRALETACPFCLAPVRAAGIVTAAALALVAGCSSPPRSEGIYANPYGASPITSDTSERPQIAQPYGTPPPGGPR